MLISQKLANNFKIKKSNLSRMRNILDIVSRKMQEQGTGCFIAGQGVAYYNPIGHTKDPIGHLLGLTKRTHLFGLISDEAQKPFVRYLIAKFQINIDRDCERDKFINFLQDLQDAHDVVFCPFDTKDVPDVNRMPMFLGNCNQIAYNYGLE